MVLVTTDQNIVVSILVTLFLVGALIGISYFILSFLQSIAKKKVETAAFQMEIALANFRTALLANMDSQSEKMSTLSEDDLFDYTQNFLIQCVSYFEHDGGGREAAIERTMCFSSQLFKKYAEFQTAEGVDPQGLTDAVANYIRARLNLY